MKTLIKNLTKKENDLWEKKVQFPQIISGANLLILGFLELWEL